MSTRTYVSVVLCLLLAPVGQCAGHRAPPRADVVAAAARCDSGATP
jgi:hypothetical protein